MLLKSGDKAGEDRLSARPLYHALKIIQNFVQYNKKVEFFALYLSFTERRGT